MVKSGGGGVAVWGRQPTSMIAKANGMTIATSHLFMGTHAAKSHLFVKLLNEIQNTKSHAAVKGSDPRRCCPPIRSQRTRRGGKSPCRFRSEERRVGKECRSRWSPSFHK